MKDALDIALLIYNIGEELYTRYKLHKGNIKECEELINKIVLTKDRTKRISETTTVLKEQKLEELKIFLNRTKGDVTTCKNYIDTYLAKKSTNTFHILREIYSSREQQEQFNKLSMALDQRLVELDQVLNVLLLTVSVDTHSMVVTILEMLQKAKLPPDESKDATEQETQAIRLQEKKDYKEARKIYETIDTARAKTNLGVLCMRGEGGPRDAKHAFALFVEAAEKGFPRAMYNLAQAYYLGLGVKSDQRQAMQLYIAAAKAGYSTVKVQLMKLFDNTTNPVVDAEALFLLGQVYELGDIEGIDKDWTKAMSLYQKAKDKGHPIAPQRLDELIALSSLEMGSDMTQFDSGLRSALPAPTLSIVTVMGLTLMGSSSSSSSSTKSEITSDSIRSTPG